MVLCKQETDRSPVSGFYRGNATEDRLKAEITMALTLNQLANNSHMVANDPETYFTVYNGVRIITVRVSAPLHPLPDRRRRKTKRLVFFLERIC